MKRKISSWVKSLFAAVLGLLIVLVISSPNNATNLLPNHLTPTQTASKQIQTDFSQLPLSFEANLGQTDGSVKFLSHGSGGHFYLTPTEAVLTLSQPQQQPNDVRHRDPLKPQPIVNTSTSVVRMQLKGANPEPQVTGLEPLPGRVNYFLGNDPKHWHTNIPTYAKVQYEQVYPGVSMVYYGNQQQLEYDFVVAPGADPNLIQLAFAGVDKLSVNAVGDLTLLVGTKLVELHKPIVYQLVNGTPQVIANNYVLQGKNQVSFHLGRYNRTQPLIIDPVLSYSTYIGGSDEDAGSGIAVDRAGNSYITGRTSSTNFPTQNPLQAAIGGGYYHVFVSKLNEKGDALVYSTYLGGSNEDTGSSITVDRAGHAYITGNTLSTNFPTKNPLQTALGGINDAFITKLNENGDALVYSTYLGGSNEDTGNSIAVDRAGNSYITGRTNSTNFPTQNPLQAAFGGGRASNDAFITKLNENGDALVYSTYFGGSNNDIGNSIAVDREGHAYITGDTSSTNFPTQNPLQTSYGDSKDAYDSSDAFITKLNENGDALVYSTYFGGSNVDSGRGIAVDRESHAYITGYTFSTNFPTQNPLQAANSGKYDAFVSKLNENGGALVYSTYLCGSNSDLGFSIAVDRAGHAYITGDTSSTNFPTQNPLQAAFGGDSPLSDAFITKLNENGAALVYSTYLGGSNSDFGRGIAVDREGHAYIIGSTFSTNFPTQNPLQASYDNRDHAFVTKLTQ